MHSLIQMMKSGSKPVTTTVTTEQPLEIKTGPQEKLAPDTKQNPDGVQEARKVDKEVPEYRKSIPCKKGRSDPLKMDMSKPVVMPLTSSQLSLQCMDCHIIFSDHKSKERHLKLSHPAEYEQSILRNALFACYVCDRHFTNSTEAMAHQKAHKEKKPFKCPICGQAFNKSSELTLHKKIHFGRDGYACSDCGKPCKTLTLLKYHRRTHTGERPYVCKECGKRFSMPKALQKHMMEPIGPLQQVDANIDTEQIRRLIESLGNVQKVNQVVILGQVPPHAPPLELQQIPEPGEPINLNFTPPQMDVMELKQCRTVELEHSKNPSSPLIPESPPTKPKTTRKRKASSKVETEEGSAEEQVVFELESVTTNVVEEMKGERLRLEGVEEQDREAGQSPGIILERFLTSRQREAGDKEQCLIAIRNNQRQGVDSIAENEVVFKEVPRGQEIKVEENISDPPVAAHNCQSRQRVGIQPQHQRDVRTVLVKQESSLFLNDAEAMQGCRHIRWNVEQIDIENTSGLQMESEDTIEASCIAPDFNANQCIFYPVKEEEREVLLGTSQSDSGVSTAGVSSDAISHETEDRPANEGSHVTEDYQDTRVRGVLSETGGNDFANTAEADVDWQHTPELRDFLLQSSDEEDSSAFELCDPQLDSEAEAMACYYKSQNSSPPQPTETSHNSPTLESQLHSHAHREGNRTEEPIDYFSKYFGWDTWVEIAQCTNGVSTMPNPVTAKEVAQFVGIHIAMGTLKFPSVKLYWQDFTKSQEDKPNDWNCSNIHTDPLWKVQPLLCRFQAGCLLLRREGDYGVDQCPLPLTTGKINGNKRSLHCTTLIGFGGLILHLDLKLDLSDKEAAVEKIVPRGSMVFLCKQELSTPAMLERLLVAGVHGAGRVGGARAQIGDEFVSSDGRLMLRRSHRGFILSTVGNGQRNMASLITNFEKAQMSARLNRDLQNLYRIPLTASAPNCWPQAVLWYLTDLALVNSWLVYRQDHGSESEPLTLMAFRLEVSKALILSSGSDTQDSVPPQPPTQKAHATSETPNPNLLQESPLPDAATRYDGSGHWPEQLEEGEGGRCRFGGCERTSRVLCLKCCVFLCISRNHNCFLNFHNQGSLGNE
ncbi:zinc finger protein 576, tandem duplicate 1 [Diretmus argenteus]